MFKPGEYYVFGTEELIDNFADWVIDVARYDDFPAPGKRLKVFSTVIARKPKEKVLNVPAYSLVAETAPTLRKLRRGRAKPLEAS